MQMLFYFVVSVWAAVMSIQDLHTNENSINTCSRCINKCILCLYFDEKETFSR